VIARHRENGMAFGPPIVAVVDDDPSVRTSLERVLGASGFTTEAYASAEAFLDGGRRADCLVLDIHLDGISGLELARRLAASGSTLPVIFITGIEEEGLEQEARESGCVAYLRKPVPVEMLRGAINTALAGLRTQ
jgi:FixJ family two-component response regulator